jgi:hypothetical protein
MKNTKQEKIIKIIKGYKTIDCKLYEQKDVNTSLANSLSLLDHLLDIKHLPEGNFNFIIIIIVKKVYYNNNLSVR